MLFHFVVSFSREGRVLTANRLKQLQLIFNQPKMIAIDKVNAYRSDEEGTGTIT
jgi:hypothetical protein